jgi:hypothetical protein
MNVIFLELALKHSRYKKVIKGHICLADRTLAGQIILQTAITAFDVHKAIYAPLTTRKYNGFDIPFKYHTGTNGAFLNITGLFFGCVFFHPREILVKGRICAKK